MGPRDSDMFTLIAHPYILYDLKSDNTVGGFTDLMKYANPQAAMSGEVGKFDNARIIASTNVGTSGAAPNVLYNTYLIGHETVGAVELPGNGPDTVTDPGNQSFNVNVVRGGPDKADPEGNIAGFVSYWFTFVAKLLKTTNSAERHRRFTADASPV
jgi:N4-gp56 family major capsid protein